MSERDSETARRLSAFADRYQVDTETDLPIVSERARRGTVRRRAARTLVAAMVAVGLTASVLVTALVLRRDAPTTTEAAAPGPAASIAERWGGAVLWSSFETIEITSSNLSRSLPFEVLAASLSPAGTGGRVYVVLGSPPADDFAVIWSPDGTVVSLPYLKPYELHHPPAWSPDGKELAVEVCSYPGKTEAVCSILLVSTTDGSFTELASSNAQGVSWSPDGASLAYIDPGDPSGLSIVDVATGAGRTLVGGGEFDYLFGPTWSPSGEFIAATASKEGIYYPVVLNLSGEVVATGEAVPNEPPSLAWESNTDSLLYAGQQPPLSGTNELARSIVRSMTPPDWAPRSILDLPGQARPTLWASRDGRAVLLQTWSVGTPDNIWTVANLETQDVSQWTVGQASVLDWR